jgi:pyridoxamine 5'-phosphate oxidase
MRAAPRVNPLADALEQAWSLLKDGAGQRSSPFHQGVLASLGEHGPEARYVVLRALDREHARLRFHSDRRAPKLTQLRNDPRATWCFFGYEVQLRLRGCCEVLSDGAELEQAWAETSDFGRRGYCARQAPGASQDQPGPGLPPSALTSPPDPAAVALGRENFAVVQFQIDAIDWLHLGHEGHRRALFEASDGWRGCWIQP